MRPSLLLDFVVVFSCIWCSHTRCSFVLHRHRQHSRCYRRLQLATLLLQIEEEAYQDDLGLSLGTLGKSSSGRVRGPLIDSKTKARISKTLQVWFTLMTCIIM